MNTDALEPIDWTRFRATRRKIHRALQDPCLLCGGEAAAVRTAVAAGVTAVEVMLNPTHLTCYALCQTCRAMPPQQCRPLVEAALAL